MNALIRSTLSGELIAPGAKVRVVGKTHPLNGGRIDRLVSAGLSIAEILHEALSDRPDLRQSREFIVHIDGDAIPEPMWPRVRAKPGTTVTFMPRLGNGGLMRTVLAAVVVFAAIIIAPYLAPGLVAGLAAIGVTVSVTTATALAGAGLMLAGTLALNALFPVPQQSVAGSALPLIGIQGAQNQANPFGPVPVVLGKNLQSPYWAAKPYTEILGDDQYLRLLFCMGYGPLAMSGFSIGTTPLSSFSDCTIEVRQGFADDLPVTLYPGAVDEQPLSVKLVNSVDPPLTNGNGGVWNRQTTAADTDEISLDFTATNGVNGTDAQGNQMAFTVSIQNQYRAVGATDWIDAPTVVFQRSFSPSRAGCTFNVTRGQYEVQSRKLTGEGVQQFVADTIVWTALRSIKNVPPLAFPKPLALIALRIKATDQLSGVIDTFNCICESLVNGWNGTHWVANTPSQNPADLFRLVLQGPANARPRTDAQIDLANLQDWWAYCTINGWKFNLIVNSAGSVYDQLTQIAAAGRAVQTFIDGKWGVIWDRPDDSIVQHFTPRNSWDFQGQKPYAQQPNGWRVSFVNETNGYTADERIVYDDGFDAGNATLFEGIQFPGITDPDLIWRFGRFHIAQSRLRPEKLLLTTAWEHLVCTRGDRVRITHDVILVGIASGRVKSVSGQIITFDEIVTIEVGKTYGFQFRVADDIRSFERAVDPGPPDDLLQPGDYNSLALVGDLSLVKAGALFGFGETGQETAVYRIYGIAHAKDLIATLTLVDDAPAISRADQGAIPPYNANVTLPVNPFTLAPRDLRAVEGLTGQGNAVSAIVRLSWAAARAGNIAASEVQIASGTDDFLPVTTLAFPALAIDVPLQSAGVWSYRVRFRFTDGTVSAWTTLANLTFAGLSGVPADVQKIRASAYVDDNASIAWDEVSDFRPVRYAVRLGDAWETALDLGTLAHPPFAAHGAGTYQVKAYVGSDAAPIYSVNAAEITIAGVSLVSNIVATRDEAANGWAGVFSGTAGKTGAFIHTGGAGDMLSLTDFLNTADFLNRGGQGDGFYQIDPSRYVDNGRVAPCRITCTWKGTGQIVTDDMLANPDILNNPDFLAASSSNLVQVYPEISIAQAPVDVFNLDPTHNPANDPFAEADVFSQDIAFGPWVKYEPGIYVGRIFRARLVLKTSDPQVVAVATAFTFSVDVQDRLDTWALVGGVGTSLNQVTVPAAGLAIVFASNGKTAAEPFNGGPGADALPLIQITNTSSSAFDFEVQSLTKNGCTIVPRLAGTPTDAPKTNISIQGW